MSRPKCVIVGDECTFHLPGREGCYSTDKEVTVVDYEIEGIPVVYDERINFKATPIGVARIKGRTIEIEMTNENYSMDDLANIFRSGFADRLELRVNFTPVLNGANPPRNEV